jgi:predicted Zn-dependent peptidase
MAKITELDNGVRVVTEKVDGALSTTVGAFVKVGARYEAPELNGISHFLEHMAFKGTKSRTAEQISFEIESVGGYSNAFTSKDMTAYYAKVLPEHTELAMDIISDSLINSKFDEAELNIERGVIIQEINRANDDPGDIAYEHLYRTAYTDQPLGRTVLGPAEHIKRFNREDFVNYVGENYGANRTILVAAGKVKHDRFVEIAEKYYGEVKKSSDAFHEPAVYEGGCKIFNKDFEQVTIACGWPTVGELDKKYYAYSIFSDYLGRGMSSPLFQEVREKRGLVYSINSFDTTHSDVGMFVLSAGTTAENVEEVLNISVKEIEKSTREIDERHLTRAKNQVKAALIRQQESSNSMMVSAAHNLFTSNKILKLKKVFKKIDAVTKDDLKKVADSILANRPTLSLVGPVRNADYYKLVNTKG